MALTCLLEQDVSTTLAYAKFRENKTLAKIPEFTVYNEECIDIFGRF